MLSHASRTYCFHGSLIEPKPNTHLRNAIPALIVCRSLSVKLPKTQITKFSSPPFKCNSLKHKSVKKKNLATVSSLTLCSENHFHRPSKGLFHISSKFLSKLNTPLNGRIGCDRATSAPWEFHMHTCVDDTHIIRWFIVSRTQCFVFASFAPYKPTQIQSSTRIQTIRLCSRCVIFTLWFLDRNI